MNNYLKKQNRLSTEILSKERTAGGYSGRVILCNMWEVGMVGQKSYLI